MSTIVVGTEPQRVAVVRALVPLTAMAQAQRHARELLDAAFEVASVAPSGSWLTVWRPPRGGMIDYAPGVRVPDDVACSAPVSLMTLPEGAAAHRIGREPFDGPAAAWSRLFDDCAAQGHDLAGMR